MDTKTKRPQRMESLPKRHQTIDVIDDVIHRAPSPSPSFRRENSTRSLKMCYGSETGSHVSRPFSDAASVRSWASVGMGSTDGKKMIVRKVPTSPVELFNIVNPPT